MRGLDDALRMEWVRIRTVRSTAALAGLALLLGVGVTIVLAASTRGDTPDGETAAIVLTSGAAFVPLPFAAVFMAVLGVLSVGHDYRHGLVRPVLAAVPGRSALLLARLYVLGAVAAGVTVLAVALNTLAAYAVAGRAPEVDGTVLRALGGYVLLAVLWAWLGAGATWLVRSTAGVLTGIFVLPLVIEPLLQALANADVASWLQPLSPWLPFSAGRLLVLTGAAAEFQGAGDVTWVQGGAVFAGFVAVFVLAGWVRFATRDA